MGPQDVQVQHPLPGPLRGFPATLPTWIEAWNPSRIFYAYDATPDGEEAAQRLLRKNNRVVRVRPALDGNDWNDMLTCGSAPANP